MHDGILKPGHLQALSFTILLGVAIFLGLSMYIGWEEMLLAVKKIGWGGLVIALSLTLVNLALRMLRWQLFLGNLDIRLPLLQSLRIYLGGLALSATPGKAGEIVRSIYLRQYGASYMKSVAMFVADRFSDLVAVVLLASAMIWTNEQARPVGILLIVIILGILLSVNFHQHYQSLIVTLSQSIRHAHLQFMLLKSASIVSHCKSLFRVQFFGATLVLSLLAWSAEGVSLYIVTQWLDIRIALTTVLTIYAFSKLIGAISMIPGGMGTTEATLIALLILQGADETSAVACALFLRLTTFWFVTTLGLIALPKHVVHPGATSSDASFTIQPGDYEQPSSGRLY